MAKKIKTPSGPSSSSAWKTQREEQQLFLNSEARRLSELYMRGELAEIEQRAEELVRQYPSWGFGWKVLGGTYAMRRAHEAALAATRKALQLLPNDHEIYNNQGNILKEMGLLEDARTAYEKAIRLRPDFAVAFNNLGNVCKNQGRLREAVRKYEAALRLNPDFVVAFGNLLFAWHYRPDQDPEQLYLLHREWEKRFGRVEPLAPVPCPADRSRPLRIGYLSADFSHHPVGIFMRSVLPHHNREQVRVYCYSDRAAEDGQTEFLKGHCDVWRKVVELSNRDLALAVRDDGIDILVDLAGHTLTNRLQVFAFKPAPVQVTWLGYPDTTGLSAMDYRLTDDIADPPGESDRFAAEQLVRMPNGFLAFPPDLLPPLEPRPPVLDRGYATFCSFNFLPKVTEQAIALWSEILRSVPGSRLVLKSPPLADPETGRQILKQFKACGVAKERIDLLGATATYEEHLLAYNGVDIALDTFPYNGTTTIFEALGMGVPVVTLTGRTHVARVGTSILLRAGLPELVAGDSAGYARIAAELAADPDRLAQLRASLRDRVRPSLYDGRRFTNDLETVYQEIWQRRCRS